MGGGGRWRSFQTNIIVHDSLERAGASGLREKDDVVSGDEPIGRNIHVVKPMEAVNSVPGDRIVPSDQPTGEHWLCFWVIYANLQKHHCPLIRARIFAKFYLRGFISVYLQFREGSGSQSDPKLVRSSVVDITVQLELHLPRCPLECSVFCLPMDEQKLST